MRTFFRFCCFSALLLATSAAIGGDVPGVTALDFGDTSAAAVAVMNASPEAHWIWSLLASDAVWNALWSLLAAAAGAVLGWLKWQGTRKEKAFWCIYNGVKNTGDVWVRIIKKAREDGKLTEEERKQANRDAIDYAIQVAKSQGFDLLKVYAKESLPAIVDYVLRLIKKESAESKSPLPMSQPALPDLAPSHTSG